MLYETVTAFLEDYDYCYCLADVLISGDGLYVYQNRQTGEFEVFDQDLDFQGTLCSGVTESGSPLVVLSPWDF